jgi:hypothetical protein
VVLITPALADRIGGFAVAVEVILGVEEIARGERDSERTAPPGDARIDERVAIDQERVAVVANRLADVLDVASGRWVQPA